MKSKYIVDPEGRRDGCLGNLIRYGFGGALVALLVWMACGLTGCASTKHVETVNTRDSIVYKVRDSVAIHWIDSIRYIGQHTVKDDSTNLVINFGPTGGTYNAKTGEATNVSNVQQTDTHHERKDSTAFYKSRYEALSAVSDSLQHQVSDYSSSLEKERQMPKRTGWDRFCTWWFLITALLLLIKIAAWVMEKIPMTAPYVMIARKFIPFL